jgi:hypothetical protein
MRCRSHSKRGKLGISRASVYYLPRPTSAADPAIMRRIDALHMDFPFAGSRMLRDLLAAEGIKVGRLHVSTLMKKMAIEAIYRRPNTSKPAPGHKIYPYLLRKLAVTRPNQVWATDITYIPMARGFVYLIAIVDWFSRRVLSWRLSITLETDFCIEALEEALTRFGAPEIFNTDQGSQFTIDAALKLRLQTEPELASRFAILVSIPGVGALTAVTMLIEMPELGQLDNKQVASLAGLAPQARDSGQHRGRRNIRGGRSVLRQALYMPALVATRFNVDMRAKYQTLIKAGKPAKVAITAVMRKLIILANALLKADRKWTDKTA